MNHLVLLGDSIFDNQAYIGREPAVIQQTQLKMAPGWAASLLAVDGHVASQVTGQIKRLPPDCTHIVLSVGGNDAIECLDQMATPTSDVLNALVVLSKVLSSFEHNYEALMLELAALQKPLVVCTIYDSVPGLEKPLKVALALFNDVILRTAISFGVPVLDLRLICTDPGDYSIESPIEPSSQGGQKISDKILDVVMNHDFTRPGCCVYS